MQNLLMMKNKDIFYITLLKRGSVLKKIHPLQLRNVSISTGGTETTSTTFSMRHEMDQNSSIQLTIVNRKQMKYQQITVANYKAELNADITRRYERQADYDIYKHACKNTV